MQLLENNKVLLPRTVYHKVFAVFVLFQKLLKLYIFVQTTDYY